MNLSLPKFPAMLFIFLYCLQFLTATFSSLIFYWTLVMLQQQHRINPDSGLFILAPADRLFPGSRNNCRGSFLVWISLWSYCDVSFVLLQRPAFVYRLPFTPLIKPDECLILVASWCGYFCHGKYNVDPTDSATMETPNTTFVKTPVWDLH